MEMSAQSYVLQFKLNIIRSMSEDCGCNTFQTTERIHGCSGQPTETEAHNYKRKSILYSEVYKYTQKYRDSNKKAEKCKGVKVQTLGL